MIYTKVRNSDGRPLVEATTDSVDRLATGSGFTWVAGAAPSINHCWNSVSSSWELASPDLAETKVKAWESIKSERDSRLKGTFEHNGQVYDVDPVNIAGAAMDAREAIIAGEQWLQAWVLADNTVVSLDAEQMIALGRAAKAVVSGLWATSQYLRGLIDGATTLEEVAAVVWP